MRIKIRTNTSPKIEELSEITLVNQIGYAKRNGYDWESYVFDYARHNEVVMDDMLVERSYTECGCLDVCGG